MRKVRKRIWAITVVILCLALMTWSAGASTARMNTYIVTNTNDSGEGSLRQAIQDANRRVGPDTIVFNIPETDPGYDAERGVWTIHLTSELPAIDRGDLIIDGNSQKEFIGQDTNPHGPEIEIDGTGTPVNGIGFRIQSANNEIIGLCINNFNGFLSEGAILIEATEEKGANRNVIRGCYIGVDPTGQEARNNQAGITIRSGAQENTIGGTTAEDRNIISGSTDAIHGYGIRIAGSDTDGNVVIGNYIGTNISGTVAIGNAKGGICVEEGARNTTIGGYESGEGNLISGNDGSGILVRGSDTSYVNIWGNIIGLSASGDADLGNGDSGVAITRGASHVAVGGRRAGKGNLISANHRYGVQISDSGTEYNTVEGNLIGTDINGTTNWGNWLAGVLIETGAAHNTIGGDSISRNVIADNGWMGTTDIDSSGVVIDGASDNYVQGNFIGTDITGTSVLGNFMHGIFITQRAQDNLIGSTSGLLYGNVVATNGADGIRIDGLDTTGNVVSHNYIGTDLSGELDLGNGGAGVCVQGGASNNTVGPGNKIYNNGASGVRIRQSSTRGNRVTQNSISDNGGKAIEIDWSPYEDPPRPDITAGAKNWVEGSAPAGSTVEIFSDPAEEGFWYEGSTQADADGYFRLDLAQPMRGRFASAAAIDSEGTTSEFSDPYEVDPLWIKTWVPIMMNGR